MTGAIAGREMNVIIGGMRREIPIIGRRPDNQSANAPYRNAPHRNVMKRPRLHRPFRLRRNRRSQCRS